MNRALSYLHGGSHRITLTVPLNYVSRLILPLLGEKCKDRKDTLSVTDPTVSTSE